jgi:ribonuclease R
LPKKGYNSRTKSSPQEIIEGRVIAHRDGFGFVKADPDDVYLNKYEMRQVFNGDIVSVKLGKADNRGRREGVILEVLERSTNIMVGQYLVDRDYAYLRPEGGSATDIHIAPANSGGAAHGQMVSVAITDYPTAFAPAHGKVMEILGDKMDAGVEIQVAIRRFAIPHEWPKGVEEAATVFGSSVDAKHAENRLDLRDQPFVTIDGEDARDFDDAVLCQRTKSGWKLWVAIADVSEYVAVGSALDQEALNRGNSVYFPDHVVPMLPEALSNGLCSLNPEVDRLAMVCEMEINAEGIVVDYRFCEAVIRSHARLTYTRVFQALEELGQEIGQQPVRSELGVISQRIDDLSALFDLLFAARQKRGAMEFETVETRIIFDRNRKIERIDPVHRNKAHRIIEECMLCANVSAADFLDSQKIPGLFRVHEPPVADRLNSLRDYLTQLGLYLGGGDKPSPADFKTLAEEIADRPDASVVQTQMLRSMQQAVYQPENLGHFGLAYEGYAHFTSPIRRYPDLLMHRAIRSVIRSGQKSDKVLRVKNTPKVKKASIYPYDEAALVELGEQCSQTERRADEATRDVMQWLKCEYLLERVGEKHTAVVSAVTNFGLFVELEDLYIEGLIHITALPKDFYEFDQSTMQLIGRSTRRIFSLGDRAVVQIARVNLDERKIDLVLADAASGSGSEPSANNLQGGRRNNLPPDPWANAKAKGKKTGKKRTVPKHKRKRR